MSWRRSVSPSTACDRRQLRCWCKSRVSWPLTSQHLDMCSWVIISGVGSHASQTRGCYLHAILHISRVVPRMLEVANGHSLKLHWHCVSEECSTHISHLYYPNVRCCCVAQGNILHLFILQVLRIPINCALAKHQSFGSAMQCRCPCPVELSTDIREVLHCLEKGPTLGPFPC